MSIDIDSVIHWSYQASPSLCKAIAPDYTRLETVMDQDSFCFKTLNLLLNHAKSRTVLPRARFRFNRRTRAIEHRVSLVACDSLEGLTVAFSIQNEPLVVPQELVLLLRLVYLFLIRKLLLLRSFLANPSLQLLKEFIDFFGCDLGLVDHESSLLAEGPQPRHNFLMFCILAVSVRVEAESSPVLRLLGLADRHVEMSGSFARPRDHFIDINLY